MRFPGRLLLLPVAFLAVGTTAASAASCPGADLGPGAQPVAAARQAVVCLTNQERTAAGLVPLDSEDHLQQGGQTFADSMVALGFFAHEGPDHATRAHRLAGYSDWTAIGENLMAGSGSLGTPRAAVDAWMHSAGHRQNMLNPSFREVGIGVAHGMPGKANVDGGTYVAEYGARRLSSYASPATSPRILVPARARAASPAVRATAARHRAAALRARVRAVLLRCSSPVARQRGGRAFARRCAGIRARLHGRQAARAKKSRKAAVVLQKAMSSHGTSPSANARTSGASGVGFASPIASAS